jgi:hypothetical protein
MAAYREPQDDELQLDPALTAPLPTSDEPLDLEVTDDEVREWLDLN